MRKTGTRRTARKAGARILAKDARDRLLVDLELQHTRSQLAIQELLRSKSDTQRALNHIQSLFQQLPIGYITTTGQGNITEWNATAADMLDPERKGLLKLPLAFLVVRQDVGIVMTHLARCRRSRQGQVVSELRLESGGRRLPVQIVSVCFQPEPKRMFHTVLIDLTERKKNESALAEAKQFSDAIIRTIHEPLVVLDGGLRIVHMNEAFSRSFKIASQFAGGWSLEAALNLWWTGSALHKKLEEALFKDIPLANFEFEVHLRHAGRRIFLFNARRLTREEKAPSLLLVALEDVTARKQAEEQLAQTNLQLQKLNDELEKRVVRRTRELSESNSQLERFCYSIAHDLRAPLRSVAGFSNVLRQDHGPELSRPASNYIDRIVASARHMDSLISDLLEYGRVSSIELAPAPVNADEALTGAIQSLGAEIEAKHARIERRAALPDVIAHKIVLETVFSNLLSNALKFVPADVTPEITIWPEERAREIRIWIGDNGIGIDRRYHRKIFEMFERLNSNDTYPGTGIGLAIVQRATQRLGGRVGVESEPGKGSRFWVSLPKAE